MWYSDSDVRETRKLMGCGLCIKTADARKPVLHFEDVEDGAHLDCFLPPLPTEHARLRRLENDHANRDSDFEEIVSPSSFHLFSYIKNSLH